MYTNQRDYWQVLALIHWLCLCICMEAAAQCRGHAASQYNEIESNYRRRMQDASRNDTRAMQEAKRERNENLRRLIDQYSPETQIGTLGADDLTALANSCEVLGRYQRCIQYSELAIQSLSHGHSPNLYYPLIRSLLNLDRVDEAEELVARVEDQFAAESDFRSVYGLLYAERLASGDLDHAAEHIDAYLQHQLDIIDRVAYVGHRLGTWLNYQQQLLERTGKDADCHPTWTRYQERLVPKVDQYFARTSHHDTRDVLIGSSLCFARFEFSRRLNPEEAAPQLNHWLRFLLREVARQPRPSIEREVHFAIDQLFRFPFYFSANHCPDEVLNELVVCLERDKSLTDEHVSIRLVRRLEQGVEFARALKYQRDSRASTRQSVGIRRM